MKYSIENEMKSTSPKILYGIQYDGIPCTIASDEILMHSDDYYNKTCQFDRINITDPVIV